MGKKAKAVKPDGKPAPEAPAPVHSPARPSALLDTRVIYCGDCLEQLKNLPDACVDLIYIDPAPVSEVELPFNSNRNYEVFARRDQGNASRDTCHDARGRQQSYSGVTE